MSLGQIVVGGYAPSPLPGTYVDCPKCTANMLNPVLCPECDGVSEIDAGQFNQHLFTIRPLKTPESHNGSI